MFSMPPPARMTKKSSKKVPIVMMKPCNVSVMTTARKPPITV